MLGNVHGFARQRTFPPIANIPVGNMATMHTLIRRTI